MIDNRAEYQRMYDVERKLWWYQILHEKILSQIHTHFGHKRSDLRILDAACGTGGLLSFLQEEGYAQVEGFDYSRHAIEFSTQRGLDVEFGNLKKVPKFRPGQRYDVIVCNDALYFLSDEEIIAALTAFKGKLAQDGIILLNIHAFSAFAGTHDVAVGSTRRFVLADFRRYLGQAGLRLERSTYWPFFLSLPILAVRSWQRLRMHKGAPGAEPAASDVHYPGDLINTTLKLVTQTEQVLLRRGPFGSSLFMVAK